MTTLLNLGDGRCRLARSRDNKRPSSLGLNKNCHHFQ
jgi:hypothetical protein